MVLQGRYLRTYFTDEETEINDVKWHDMTQVTQ